MINEVLQPYLEYKETGIPWLGEVPAHWETRRLKTLFGQRSEKGHPNKPLLAATQTKGVVRKDRYENRTVLPMKDLHLLKLVQKKDFVISLRSFQGGIEYAHDQGIISPAYTILYLKEAQVHSFLAYLFKSQPFIENLKLYVTGIRQGQNIDYTRLSRSDIPIPPPAEQRAIARYLTWADQHIQRLIRTREKQIELLEEHKQALIQQAVTGQIDVRTGEPYPEYKDSGVEWLGQVPVGWEMRRLKSISTINDDTISEDANPNMKIKYVDIGSVDINKGIIKKENLFFKNAPSRARRKVRHKDVILSTVRTYLKAIADIVNPENNLIVSTGFAVIRPKENINSFFLAYALHSNCFIDSVIAHSIGVNYPAINSSTLATLSMSMPPQFEQGIIVDYLDLKTTEIKMTIENYRRTIETLKEYRTRLIADVVTGKVDVRAIAKNLPEDEAL